MKVYLCERDAEPSRARSLIQVVLETRMWQRKIKKYTNNLSWKALPPIALSFTALKCFDLEENSLRAREPLFLFHSILRDKEHALEGYRTSSAPGLLLHRISYFISYIPRRDYPFISGFSRTRFSLLQIVPAICKSSRLLEARSIWLFCTVS